MGHFTRNRLAGKGMSLLEVLCAAVLLAVVINLAARTFISSSRLAAFGTAALDKMVVLDTIHNDFVASVRGSGRLCSGIGRYRSGRDTVVLEMPQSVDESDVRRYIVFGPIESESRLSRLQIVEQGGEARVERFVTYRQALDSIRFSYDSDEIENVRQITMDIETRKVGNRSGTRPVNRCIATMRAVGN